MEIIQYLKSIYPAGTPIFLKDIRIGRKSKSAIRQELYRAARRGEILRKYDGVYYFKEDASSSGFVLYEDVLEQKYIHGPTFIERFDIDVYGYYDGLTAANMLGFTPQHPFVFEVCTNRTSSKKRTICLGGHRAILRKSRVEVDFQNWRILQFFGALKALYPEEIEENRTKIKNYIDKWFDKTLFDQFSPFASAEVMKVLEEENLIKEFR